MAWLTLVEDTPKANASYGTTLQISTSTATQVGDTLLMAIQSYSGLTTGVTDDAGNTYTRVAKVNSSYGKYQELWQASVTKASASAVVTATASANEYYSGAAYQLRGSAIAVVSGGILTASRVSSAPGTTPLAFPALTTSAPTFALLLGGCTTGLTPNLPAISTPTSWTQDASSLSGVSSFASVFGHILTTSAISGDVESIYVPGQSGNVGMGGMIVPFVAPAPPNTMQVTSGLVLSSRSAMVQSNAAQAKSALSLRLALTLSATDTVSARLALQAQTSAHFAQSMLAHASSALVLRSQVSASSENSAIVRSALPSPTSHGSVSTSNSAYVAQALGMASRIAVSAAQSLSASWALSLRWIGTFYKVASNLPPDAWYFAQMPARFFYGALPVRFFYAAIQQTMPSPILSYKDPRESVVVTLDATPDLAQGETLTAILSSAVTLEYGVDPSPSAVIGTPQINPQALTIVTATKTVTVGASMGVQVEATGGLNGCGYLIAVTCSTSNPNKVLTLKAVLPVSAQ